MLGLLLLIGAGAWFGPGLVAKNRVVGNYTRMLSASFAGDLDGLRRLCSERYLETHQLKAAPEGGVVGMPRGIHKNFKAWIEGDEVWFCPTNRVGAVYRFVREGGDWKFDGPVGLLRPGRQFLRMVDGADEVETPVP